MSINRRKVLGGAGLAGAAAATGVGVDRLVSGYRTDKDVSLADDAARFGDPRIPSETITSQSHLFHLGAQPFSMPLAGKKKVRTGNPVLATPPTHID